MFQACCVSSINKVSNAHDFALNESIFYENSDQLDFRIDDMNKNVPTKLMNLSMMKL